MATPEELINEELGYAFGLQSELSDYIGLLRKAKTVVGDYAFIDLTTQQKQNLKARYETKRSEVKQAAITLLKD